jgi:hypothetical protein
VSHVRITRRRVVTDDKFWLFFVLGHPPFAETGIWPFETYDDIGLGKKVVMLDLQPGIDIEEAKELARRLNAQGSKLSVRQLSPHSRDRERFHHDEPTPPGQVRAGGQHSQKLR